MGLLDEKVVVVTGAASGIGEAVARRALAEGAAVAAWDRDPVDRDAIGERADLLALEVDLVRRADVDAAAAAVAERFGGVDVLVNCAGTITPNLPVEETSEADFRRCFDVNVLGTVNAAQALHGYLREGGGAVVNVASQAALVCLPHQSAYSASKGAVSALTRSMAIDWATAGVRVNAVCPGFTLTPMAAGQMTPELDAAVSRRVPLGRVFAPEEIANAILFLASPLASAVTGVVMPVDGGWTAGEPALPMGSAS